MVQFLLSVFLCSSIVVSATAIPNFGEPAAPPTWESETPNTECGLFLTSPFEVITYASIYSNRIDERCVWVVSPPQAIQFRVNILTESEEPFKDGFLVNSLDHASNGELTTQHIGNGSHILDASILIITFYSNAFLNPMGFQMEIEVTETSERPNYTSEIISSAIWRPNSTRVKYPVAEETYGNQAIGTFLYSPDFRLDVRFQKNAIISLLSLQSECKDAINAYEFSRTDNQWHFLFRICGDSSMTHVASLDMILLVFVSDLEVVGEGFVIDFSIQPNPNYSI